MNKTRRRAIQKHRAKEQKFDLKRRSGEEPAAAAARNRAVAAQPATTPRARTATPSRSRASESGEAGQSADTTQS